MRGGKTRPHSAVGWYAETDNIEMAERFLTAVDSTLEMLASQTESGPRTFTTKTTLHGMRRFPVSDGFEKLLLFYLPLHDGVDLVRVVHGSRDLSPKFFG